MNRTFTLLLCTLLTGTLLAQITPATAVAEMGRGINLGNTLEPPNEGDWNNGPAQETYFDAYVAAGFTNVRVPVRWDEHTADAAPYTIDATWMDRVEQVVDWGLERNLYVTLNGHHEDWLKNDYATPATRARYDSIWVQIAERFKDKSDRLLFEIINEPFGMTVAQVDELNQRTLDIIRKTNPTRLVIFGGNQYANAEELLLAAVPDDEYLIGYFHSYDPWSFAGQGMGTWGTPADYAALDEKFGRVDEWSQRTGVPVHLSEFGAVRSADYNSRMRYYAAYVEAALRYDFAFSVWDDGGDFGILERESVTWPEVKDVLINTYADSPTDLQLTPPEAEADEEDLEMLLTWTNRSTADSVWVERRTGTEAFTTLTKLAPSAETYRDTTVEKAMLYTYRIATRRADGTLLQSYPARAQVAAGPRETYADTLVAIPGIVQAENFDRGGEGVAYHDADPENQGGEYRPDEGVDLVGNGDGGFAVGYVAGGEWLEYSVTVDTGGVYAIDARVASAVGGGTFRVSNSRNAATATFTVTGDGTGGYEVYDTFTATGTMNLMAGEQILRVDVTGAAAFNLDYLQFRLTDADPNAVINYADGLDTATTRFTGEPAGTTYALADGVLTVVGDGTAPPYQTFRYTLPSPLRADAIGSNNLLYIGARTLSGDPVSLRVDLVDENDIHTTNAGRTVTVEGTEFSDYRFDFANGYQDGGYGGTSCGAAAAPCAVNGSAIVALTFYLDPAEGGFDDSLQIDYLSFGVPFDEQAEPTGIVNYADELDEAGAQFQGTPEGLNYFVEEGELVIAGDGTSPQYQTLTYDLRDENGDPALADVLASSGVLYVRARKSGEGSSDLRIDLIDRNNFHTTLAGRTVAVESGDYAVYSFDFTDGYADGGYGGTACNQDTQPCAVDGSRIARLSLYVDPTTGAFGDSLFIDWLSFGNNLSTSVGAPSSVAALGSYPNPAVDRVTVAFQQLRAGTAHISVLDGMGRTVRESVTDWQAAGPVTQPVSVGDLPAGVYYLRVRLANEAGGAIVPLVVQ